MDLGRIERAVSTRFNAARRRWWLLDRLWRAWERYDGVYGSRLAASIAYYSFFAAFALAVLVFAVVGWVVPGRGDEPALRAVQDYLSRNLPQLEADKLTDVSSGVGILALVALVLAGVGWVETLRSSQRAIWCLNQQPGHPVIRWLVDLAVLVCLGILLLASLAVSTGIRGVLVELTREARDVLQPVAGAMSWTDTFLAALVDFVLALAVLAGVPRLRMSFRRLLPPALLVVVGLGVLKVLGRWVITRTQHNPAYEGFTAAAAAVGLLLFMFFFNQIVLFAAALAATSDRGSVLDLANRPPKVVEMGTDEVAAQNAGFRRIPQQADVLQE